MARFTACAFVGPGERESCAQVIEIACGGDSRVQRGRNRQKNSSEALQQPAGDRTVHVASLL
ncbi:MAG: hypothetical protein ACE5FL_04335 [Myxococcota bacterium]